MRQLRRCAYVCNIAVVSVALVMSAAGASDAMADDVDRVRELRSTESIRPLSDILKGIEKKYPGTLLEVELEEEDGRIIYEIEMLDRDRNIHHLEVDARTGLIVHEGDD